MINERFDKAHDGAPNSDSHMWSDLAAEAYNPHNVKPIVSCVPRFEEPPKPEERPEPFPESTMEITPLWRMNPGCRQIPRRPGAD